MLQMRMNPPGTEEPVSNENELKKMGRLARFIDVDKEYYEMKLEKKVSKPKRRLSNRLG